MPQLVDGLRAVAFDLDGTLIDSVPDLAQAVQTALQSIGAAPLATTQIAAFVGDGVETLVARALVAAQGRQSDVATLHQAMDAFTAAYSAHLFELSHVYPGVELVLAALRERGTALSVVTNKPSHFAVPLLRAAGLSEFFSTIACADRREDRKPLPKMLFEVCHTLQIKPAQLLLVGDSRADVDAARAAGCPVVTVSYGYGHGLGHNQADWSIDSIEALLTLPSHTVATIGNDTCSPIAPR